MYYQRGKGDVQPVNFGTKITYLATLPSPQRAPVVTCLPRAVFTLPNHRDLLSVCSQICSGHVHTIPDYLAQLHGP